MKSFVSEQRIKIDNSGPHLTYCIYSIILNRLKKNEPFMALNRLRYKSIKTLIYHRRINEKVNLHYNDATFSKCFNNICGR